VIGIDIVVVLVTDELIVPSDGRMTAIDNSEHLVSIITIIITCSPACGASPW